MTRSEVRVPHRPPIFKYPEMNNSDYLLDEHEAFLAMTHFLIKFARRTSGPDGKAISTQMATLLADISVQEDGDTKDPAAWQDWIKSIESAKKKLPSRSSDRQIRPTKHLLFIKLATIVSGVNWPNLLSYVSCLVNR